jgi:hypothetical protein
MAIYRRFNTRSFGAANEARMGTAFEILLTRLGLKDRDDALTELLATRVIEAFEAGENDPQRICAHVLARIGIPNPDPR